MHKLEQIGIGLDVLRNESLCLEEWYQKNPPHLEKFFNCEHLKAPINTFFSRVPKWVIIYGNHWRQPKESIDWRARERARTPYHTLRISNLAPNIEK